MRVVNIRLHLKPWKRTISPTEGVWTKKINFLMRLKFFGLPHVVNHAHTVLPE